MTAARPITMQSSFFWSGRTL